MNAETEQSSLPEIQLHIEVAQAADDNEFDLAEFWIAVLRRFWFMAAVAVPFVVAAVALALLLPQYYRASVLMAHAETDTENSSTIAGLMGQFGGLASLGGLAAPATSEGEQALAILKSRAFSWQFIESENLMPVLFAKKWDATNNRWQEMKAGKTPTRNDAIAKFNEKVRGVSTDKTNGLITLSIEWKDPQLAADWANRLVDDINAELRSSAIQEAEKSLAYLNLELGKTRIVEVKKLVYSLIEIQMNKIMLANTREQYAFKVIDPAVAPEADDESWPNRKLIVFLGGLLGGFVGFMLVVRKEWQLRTH